MKKLLLLLLAAVPLCLQPLVTQAQEATPIRCYSTEMMHAHAHDNPDYLERVNKTFEKALERSQTDEFKAQNEILRVPVVVHIVYNTPQHNLDDAVVHSQLEVLNEDYRRQNANAGDTRAEFLSVAGDPEIEFYLATHDPDGNEHSGITRTQTDVTTFGVGEEIEALVQAMQDCGITDPNDFAQLLANLPCLTAALDAAGIDITQLGNMDLTSGLDEVKFTASGGIDAWPTEQYLNIWVCDLGGALLGFAYPPADAPNWPEGQTGTPETEGVVVHNEVFGRDNPITPSNFEAVVGEGRTCVHEVGHYLGLRHIWGDGDCAADDGITDTPPAADQSQQMCSFAKNTCSENPDLPDMIENYMDYSDENCMNMFTNGQIDIMRAMLLGPRAGLLEPLVPQPPSAYFAFDNEVFVGEEVQFTDQSLYPTSWFWDFGDGGQSLEQNPVHTYTEPGTYTITLVVNNDVNSDQVSFEITVLGNNVGIGDNTLQNSIQIAPNPTSGSLNINLSNLQNAQLSIYNVAGKQIVNMPVNNNNNLNLSSYSNGIYFVQISVDGAVYTEKILLQK